MYNRIFIITLTLFFSIIYFFAFRSLPKEKWQFMAVIPIKKTDNDWSGLNLTWYGFFTATAYCLSVALVFLLAGSIDVPITGIIVINFLLLITALPAAKIIARLVEKKKNTITIGGATFIGHLLLPWAILFANFFTGSYLIIKIDLLPFIATITIAYSIGEGFGRLACLSFGCCYGKKIKNKTNKSHSVFKFFNMIFYGKTKKIAYASNLEGIPVIPVQAITAILYTTIAITGIYLFLNQNYAAAILLTVSGTQTWRFISEFLRADYRGEKKISAYQVMSLLLVPYYIFITLFYSQPAITIPDLAKGFTFLWDTKIILLLQSLWLLIFLYTGKSTVTASNINFYVRKDSV